MRRWSCSTTSRAHRLGRPWRSPNGWAAAFAGPSRREGAVHVYRLSHPILSEGGLGWNVRLLKSHPGLTTEGREKWPLSRRLPGAEVWLRGGRGPAARARAIGLLKLLAQTAAQSEAAGHAYLLTTLRYGAGRLRRDRAGRAVPVAARDVPDPADRPQACAGDGGCRRARRRPTGPLLRHRDLMYARHLRVPVRL